MPSSSDHAEALRVVRQHAEAGRFDEFFSLCRHVTESLPGDLNAQLDIGTLLSNFGFLTEARTCYIRAQALDPTDQRPTINLANLARDSGEHKASRDLYADLLTRLPDHPVIRRNALTSLEYDPEVTDAERLEQAKAWGEWAITRAGGEQARPVLLPLNNRPPRIGYVSADLCQHTVGLFLKDVLKAHDPAKLTVIAYSAGQVADWVTQEIRTAATFRDVARLDDAALADLIRQDRIDLLVDLSGHTAGSRLTVFAHRPAPVMVSWLGYFATTGLPYIDAVLLDKWHAPHGMEAQFTEPILSLPQRLCYTPVPWMPAVSPAPTFTKGHITFGSFNNTAKYHPQVFDLWARILQLVPNSRLILKWRTFNDEAFRQKVSDDFAARGVSPERIELRGPSFHVDLLKEYADLDIALDPIPFTGGLTSCEALWMGVPVITWPQSRVVSRQTYAFLRAIGLPELAAKDADDYVRIAVKLANNPQRLMSLRQTLRQRMQASPLCNVASFTRNLETTLIQLYENIAQSAPTMKTNPKILLNVGAGHPQSGARIPVAFQSHDWQEVRLDIEPANEPDILGTMLDMSAVASESIDAIYSSHNIEHLYPNEIPPALQEFLRVLKPEGYAVITCPDLQAAAQMIAEDKLMEAAYTTRAGKVITPFDIVYSYREFTGRDKPYMAHHCGFTLKVLIGTLRSNGFASVAGKSRPQAFDLWVVATKQPMEEGALRELAGKVLPADMPNRTPTPVVALYQQGSYVEAEAAARQILATQSGNLQAWQILGAALQKQGKLKEALAVKQAAAERFPDDSDIHSNLGNALLEKGDLALAEVSYRRALALRPDFPACKQQLAQVRYGRGDLDGAEALCREQADTNPIAATLLGTVLHAKGKLPAAVLQIQSVVQRFPNHADAHSELGRLQRAMNQLWAAETSYRQALTLDPNSYHAQIGIGLAFNAQNRLVEAENAFNAAIRLDPLRTDAHVNLANTLKDQGRLEEAIARYEQALALDPNELTALSNRLFALQHLPGETVRQEQAAREYGRLVTQGAPLRYQQWSCDPKPENLRVGLVSSDFRVNPVGYFLESVLTSGEFHHIDWLAYATHTLEDDLTDRLRAHCQQWTSLVGLSDAEATQRIHADAVHVLIDLTGHTARVRLPIFACRPAPVQVSWLGYFATTGMSEIDYLLADPVSVPVGMEEQFVETVWRLPETRLCFTPPPNAPPVMGLPAEQNGYITFGSVQNLAKATDEVLSQWAGVMRAVPSSKLRWQSRQLGDQTLSVRVREKLKTLGVAEERVTLVGEMPRMDYLAAYAEVDLMLDTFPFTGGTTTCEALWMGVPTLTLAGNTLIGRQGASLMTSAGLPDWVVESPADYVAQAVHWAGNLSRLGEVRAGLREQVRYSALCDAPRFARHLESALWGMWNERGASRTD